MSEMHPPPMQQNPDGSWSEAVPLGWQGPDDQVDWEVARGVRHWIGQGYNRRTHVGTVVARTKLGLRFKAWRKTGHNHLTFLWD